MVDADNARDAGAPIEAQPGEALQADAMKDRVQRLVASRDAGELSDAELEEQKAKLRWSIGP